MWFIPGNTRFKVASKRRPTSSALSSAELKTLRERPSDIPDRLKQPGSYVLDFVAVPRDEGQPYIYKFTDTTRGERFDIPFASVGEAENAISTVSGNTLKKSDWS